MGNEDSLATGKSLDYIPKEMYEKAARDFSEGNPELEKLLLYCFENEIKTFACCAGHEDRNMKPYIGFDYSEQNMATILKIVKRLLNSNGLSFSFDKKHFVIRSLGVNPNQMFESIREACESPGKVMLEDLELTEQSIIKSLDQSDINVLINCHGNQAEYTYTIVDKNYINALLQGENSQYYNEGINVGEKPAISVGGITGKDMQCVLNDLSMIQTGKKEPITYNPIFECQSVTSFNDNNIYNGGINILANRKSDIEKFAGNVKGFNGFTNAFGRFDGIDFNFEKYDTPEQLISSYNKVKEERGASAMNRYEFSRRDGIKISLSNLGNITERYGMDGKNTEDLQKFNVSFTMPNGKVIDNVEIVGQIDNELLNNNDYIEFISEYYLDPKRIQSYIRDRDTNYIGFIEECPKSSQNPEGFVKKITPEIMDRYKIRKQRDTEVHRIGEVSSDGYNFKTQDGTSVELTDIRSFYASGNNMPPLHEYHAKITNADGLVREGCLFGRIDMTKMQERMGTEYNTNAQKYKNFVEHVYLEPRRLIRAMVNDGGYIGRITDDGQIPTGIDYGENYYESCKGKNSLLRATRLTEEGLKLDSRESKREREKSNAYFNLTAIDFNDSRYYEQASKNLGGELLQSAVKVTEDVVMASSIKQQARNIADIDRTNDKAIPQKREDLEVE